MFATASILIVIAFAVCTAGKCDGNKDDCVVGGAEELNGSMSGMQLYHNELNWAKNISKQTDRMDCPMWFYKDHNCKCTQWKKT